MRYVFALLTMLLLTGPVRAVDVSQLSDFENDPCVIGLAERNTAQKIGAPDSALSDACERAHGSIEVGWDIILRTWKAPDVSQTSTATARTGLAAMLLGVLGLLLVTATLGWPVRAIYEVSRTAPTPRRLLAEAALSLAGRLVVGMALLAALTIPYAPTVAAVLLLLLILRRPRLGSAASRGSATAEILAGAINDVAASLPCLLGLALFARGNVALLVVGALLAAPFSWFAMARLWRGLRGALALGALLAAMAATVALADPAVGRTLRLPALGIVVPLAFAAVVLWRGIAGGQLRALRLRPAQRPPQVPGV